jgi:hypothetical protein
MQVTDTLQDQFEASIRERIKKSKGLVPLNLKMRDHPLGLIASLHLSGESKDFEVAVNNLKNAYEGEIDEFCPSEINGTFQGATCRIHAFLIRK